MPKRVIGNTAKERAPARLVNSAHIVGVAEGASFFDVNPATFSNWSYQRDSNKMPLPIAVLSSGTFYDLQELLDWWLAWTPVRKPRSGSLDLGLVQVYGLGVTG